MILLLIFLYPIVELFLWIGMADVWGWGGNILEVLISGFLGLFFIKRGGVDTLWKVQQAALQGRSPAAEVFKAFCFLLGGILLILPGVLSDIFGFAFVLPGARHLLAAGMLRSWSKSQRVWVRVGQFGPMGGFYSATSSRRPTDSQSQNTSSQADVIEVEAVSVRKISPGEKDSGP